MIQMHRNRRLADAHAGGDLAARKSFDAAERDGFAATRRQIFQSGLQAAQLVARKHARLRPRRIERDAQRIEIGHRLDGHDMLALARD